MSLNLHVLRRLSFLITFLILAACSSSSNNTPEIDDSLSFKQQLQQVVDNAVESGLPGVSLHVQIGDEHISVVAGVINLESEEPVSPSSLSHVGSTGKTFVATMILRLIDAGFLQLNDPIDDWLDPSMSSMIADSDKITVEMLLAHTSGIEDYFDLEFAAIFGASAGKIWPPMELLEYINNTENLFEPGSEFSYSNTNYVLLGVIAERITGLSIGTALRQWVFEPAGLENTYGVFENLGQPITTHGYIPLDLRDALGNADLPIIGSYLDTTVLINSEGLGDAPIHSNPSDLNSFIRTLLDTDLLLSEELKRKMITESFPGVSGFGAGLFLKDGGVRFGHGATGVGLRAEMDYIPSEDISFATTANASFGNYQTLYNEYLNQLFLVLEGNQ